MYKLFYQWNKTKEQSRFLFCIEENHRSKDIFAYFKIQKAENPRSWKDFNFLKDINE